MWGFGTTVLHLATGQLPYNGLTPHQMLTAMIKQRSPAVPDTLPEWLQHFLKQCLTFDVAARPSAGQLLKVIHVNVHSHHVRLHYVDLRRVSVLCLQNLCASVHHHAAPAIEVTQQTVVTDIDKGIM